MIANLLFCACTSQGQSSSFTIDTSVLHQFILRESFSYQPPVFLSRESLVETEPEEGDTILIRSNRQLIVKGPDYKNYKKYAELAGALYRRNELTTAKKMFLNIIASKELYYTGKPFHSAGNIYEYGSYTSSYKNEACQYLCKIFIKQKNYRLALSYLSMAENVYTIQYNCGTGANAYRSLLNSLYAVCYMGLGELGKLTDLYLAEDFYNDEDFIKVIQKKYSRSEIERYLHLAKENITVVKDDFESKSFMEDKNGEDSLVEHYTNGTASTIIFGRKTTLPRTRLVNGETITRQHYISEFINSEFYTRLLNIKKPDEDAGL